MSSPIPLLDTLAQMYELRERAIYLRSPDRKTGPSPHEAEEAAKEADDQADAIATRLYWESGQKAYDTWLKDREGKPVRRVINGIFPSVEN